MAEYSLIPDDLHEGLGAGVQDLGEGAEMLDHPLGQGLDVGVGDGEGQEQLQELIVLQGPGASRRGSAAAGGRGARGNVVLPVFPPFLFPFYSGQAPIATGKTMGGRGGRPGRCRG